MEEVKGSKPKAKKVSKAVVPKHIAEEFIDFSQHYKSFYDIFVGNLIDPKNFDVSFVIRDTRNMYASFVNIMDHVGLKKKYQFEQAPMEKSLSDYYQQQQLPALNMLSLVGKSINDLELELKNRVLAAA